MNIRTATNRDRDMIQGVYLRAFPEGEGEIVSKLAVDLLSEATIPRTISLVAEADGDMAGHIAFSPVTIGNNERCRGYILAPLAVNPECQKRRIGSSLIDYGMRQLSDMGVNVVFVYGDPNYYGRFGFSAEAAHRFIAPYKLQYPFGWQAVLLDGCEIGNQPAALTCVASLQDPKLW